MVFSLSYFYNRSNNEVKNTLYRHYFTSDATELIYSEDNINKTENINHRANIRMEYKFDTLNSILFQPRVSFQDNSSQSGLNGINTDINGRLSDAISGSYKTLRGISFSSPILYRHSFNKKGRTFSINLNPGYNQNKGNGELKSEITYYSDTIPPDTTDQLYDQNSHTWNNSTELNYTEPVGKTGQLSLTYRGNYISSVSDKNTFSYSPTDNLYNTIDTLLTNNFKRKVHHRKPLYKLGIGITI